MMRTDSSAQPLAGNADPFADPVQSTYTERDLITEATLAVGRNASLTLTKDSLIVLGRLFISGLEGQYD